MHHTTPKKNQNNQNTGSITGKCLTLGLTAVDTVCFIFSPYRTNYPRIELITIVHLLF